MKVRQPNEVSGPAAITDTERMIDNVRFSEAIYFRGAMITNIKQGHEHAEVYEEKGGIIIDVPAMGNQRPRFITKVPFSKVRQIEFTV